MDELQSDLRAVQFNRFVGDDAIAERIRTFDWSKTPLGAFEAWSPALRMMVRFLLTNRFPLLLWWGPQYISIYNDAYRPILGAKHPWALGQPVSECWSEIWDVLQPLIDTPFHGGPATWNDDLFLEINRSGFIEEAHFTVAYSPVPDESVATGIGGVLATVHETTERVIGERRLAALRDLGAGSIEARTADEACSVAAKTLAAHNKDVPFVLLYLLDADGKRVRLAGSAGFAPKDAALEAIYLDVNEQQLWPLAEVIRDEKMRVVGDLGARLGASAPRGYWSDPPHEAIAAPIRSNIAHRLTGVLVAGVSPRRKLDESYRNFFELVAAQISASVDSAQAYAEERKRAEALAEIDQVKTAFFANVSHEFRTPLTLMLGPIEDLLSHSDSELSPAAKGRLEVAHRNSLRLLRLVNTLLDFSRIEAGRVQAVFERTDLATLTTDLASAFQAAIDRAGLKLSIDCPQLSEPVWVDHEMWEKIVLNLMSNAFKFTFDGEISITLKTVNAAAEFCVHDTGVGIAAEEMPHIFERFHRVETSRSRTHEGSGIGLALVQELVKLHGGSIRAESRLGVGSTFIVTIPLGAAHLKPEQIGGSRKYGSTRVVAAPFVEEALRWLPDDTSPPEPTLSSKDEPVPAPPRSPDANDSRSRLLVADDNADMRRYLMRLLGEHYEVDTVPDGEAALMAARERRPDLILSDIMMPRLDGFGLVRALRADANLSAIPVIFLSARAGEESRVEGLQEGANDYIVKPFAARELLARVTTHLDIARRRKQEQEREKQQALSESEKRLRALVEASANAVYRMSGDWTEMRHLHSQNFLSDTYEPTANWLQKYILPEDRAEVIAVIDQAVRTKRIFELEHRVLRADGRVGWTSSRAVPIFDESGQVSEWFGVASDITARKEAHEALRESDRLKDEFLATLAHELRTPLGSIYNAIYVLKTESDHGSSAFGVAERQTNHLIRLVDDLLEISRISRGTIELRKEKIAVDSVTRDAVDACRPLIDQKDHRLTVKIIDKSPWVLGDPIRLVQIISNLINNAAKYTPPNGDIEIKVIREDGDAVLSVSDNGMGITAEALPRVFDLFSRAHGSTSGDAGLGIGLSLVQKLVALHGGHVEAHSPGVGRGSVFIVRLPLAEKPMLTSAEDTAMVSRPKETEINRMLRALVIEDDRDFGDVFGAALQALGVKVCIVRNGISGIAIIDEFKPDVIFLDIGMPGIDGYETARRIRAKALGDPFFLVALTGWGQEKDRLHTREAGFDAHLTKPTPINMIKELLDGIRSNRGTP